MLTNEQIEAYASKNGLEEAKEISVDTIKGSRFGGSLSVGMIVNLPNAEGLKLYQQDFNGHMGYFIIADNGDGEPFKLFVSALYRAAKEYEWEKDKPIRVKRDSKGNAIITEGTSECSLYYKSHSIKEFCARYKALKVVDKTTKKAVGFFGTEKEKIYDVVFYKFTSELRKEEKKSK